MRSILYFIGIFLVILSFCMIAPILADLYFKSDDWIIFFWCLVFTSFTGGCLLLGNIAPKIALTRKQALILASSSWVILCIFGAMPFYLSNLKLGAINSFFESVSGLTTTGSTVITNLDHAPPGILIWRSMLQWAGGVMAILMAYTILPFLKIGGMQIFRSEFTKDDASSLRMAEYAKLIILIYTILTGLCAVGYMLAGMEVFDALAHSMSTISTGGFSTYSDSFAHFNNFGIEIVAVIFMLIASLPFILFIGILRGNIKTWLKDQQISAYICTIGAGVIVLFIYLFLFNDYTPSNALRQSLFSFVSMISGTGFFNNNTIQWDNFYATSLLFLIIIGGCAGSTTGGIKIFRFQILYTITIGQLNRLIYPNSVHIAKFNKKPLSNDIPLSVMGFLFVFALSFLVLTLALSLTGIDITTSITSSIAAISNSGSGMATIFNTQITYASLNSAAKLILCLGMILGRLELYTFILMLSPYFWRL